MRDHACIDRYLEEQPWVGERMVLRQRQFAVAGEQSCGADAEKPRLHHVVMVPERAVAIGGATVRTACPFVKAAVYARLVSTPGPPRLRVGIVGAGRVGAVLGAALRRAGHDICAVSAVSDVSRLRAEALLPGVAVLPMNEVVADVDLVLLAVPDDVLPTLVAGLVQTGSIHAGQFVVHPSGRYGIGVLDPARAVGALPLAIHPVMTFTGTSVDLARLADCPFGVTADDAVRPVAEALVVEMGGEPVWVPESARSMYHAAIVFGANYLMTVVLQSLELLRAAGIAEPQRLMAPLLSASLDNALRHGDAALTGPVARGDAQTVSDHLARLSDQSPVVTDAYRALARLTADRALAAGLIDPAAAQELLGALATRTGGA